MKGLIVTYALTYGGAIASFVNPFYGLLVYVVFAIIRPESLWFWSVAPGNYSRIVAIALLAGWVMHGMGNWNLGRAKAIVFCIVGFWLWSICSAYFAPRSEYAWAFVETKSKIFLPFVVGITIIENQAQIRALAWAIVVSQGYVAFDLNMSYLDGFNRFQEIGFGGMDNNSAAIGMVAAAALSFFVGIAEKKPLLRLIAFVCAALTAHCCLIAFSRGAMLALCFVAALSPIFVMRRPKDLWTIVVAGTAGLLMAGRGVLVRFASTFAESGERDGSAQSRLDLWADCWDAMLKNPIFGLGPDHWPLAAASYGWPSHKEAHSLWMQTGAELGFIGLGLLLLFYILCITKTWDQWRFSFDPDRWDSYIPAMMATSLCGFMIAAQFVSLEGLEIPYYINLLGAAWLKLKDEDHV